MEEKAPSKRETIQHGLAAFLAGHGLAHAYGVIEGKAVSSTGRSCRTLTFCKTRNLDGAIRIFGENWIEISYQTRYLALPRYDRRVFGSVADATEFLRLAFVLGHYQDALAIPQRERKGKPMAETPGDASRATTGGQTENLPEGEGN